MRMICKRLCRRLLIFILLLVTPVLAVQIRRTEAPPPGGFYMAENTPAAQRIAAHLLKNGFVACGDPETVPEQVELGSLSCGIIFPEDLSRRLFQGSLKESITMYVSPTSFAPTLYQSHVAAAVFREYVPYLCATAFEETAVTQEAVLAQYESLFADGYAFSFDIVPQDGDWDVQSGKNRSMAIGTAATILLSVLLVLAAESAARTIALLPRLGLGKSIAAVLLPEAGITVVCAAAFAGCGLTLAGFPELLLPTVIYCIVIWGVSLMIYSILWSIKRCYLLLPVLVIAAAAVCPIYVDLSLLLPWLEKVRMIVPVYWLWCIPEQQGLWLAIAAAVLAAGISSITLRCSALHKFKF